MASSQHVEVEAAKFLDKLIKDSKDEPSKLATKLYVICQHMKMSGKEQSLPYQVISRAMKTVVSQHRLDIESLKSSRLPIGGVPQTGDSSQGAVAHQKQTGGGTRYSGQTSESKEESFGQTSQNIMFSEECKEASVVSERAKVEFLRHNVMNRGTFPQSLENESSASVPMEDNSTASDTPTGRKETKKKSSVKRKRADSKESSEIQGDDPQQSDSAGTRFNSWKGKQSARVVAQSPLSSKDGEHSHAESILQGAQMGQGSETRRQLKGITEREANPIPMQKTEKTSPCQPSTSNMPFKEHHLKQLRAQCLVFLAFRNNVSPRKLHLEIALGETYPKEDGNHQGSIDVRGKSSLSQEQGHHPESPGSLVETESSSKDTDKNKQSKAAVEQHLSSSRQKTVISPVEFESPATTSSFFSETKSCENDRNRVNQPGTLTNQHVPSSLRKSSTSRVVTHTAAIIQHEGTSDGGINLKEQSRPYCIGERTNIPTKLEFPILETNMARDRNPSLSATKGQSPQVDILKSSMSTVRESHSEKLAAPPEFAVQENKTGVYSIEINGLDSLKNLEKQKQSISNGLKTVIYCDGSRSGTRGQMVERSMEHDDESSSMESLDTPLSPPKFSTSEKWIILQKKRKSLEEEKWMSKQRTAEKNITACFEKLKENVNASEDISAKTKSVIELKKLQLLQVQRRLRSDFLSDFFKPISSEMEHLKSVKKHRHGRKIKQLERFEQKMKEERQKRIRERQKEFFGEIEAHKERLEDYFKFKRERFKGINRYIKEFHKRKERIYREKIDRIQREKINLLKANDVEGYLRMVQDAKSDRVKQLLKETEKYLQKLGAKIKEAKCTSRSFGGEVEDSDVAMTEENEILGDPRDENDQAQHYLESNEKYYLLAHSVKETIEGQPASLRGGKLREYQMNGLRWLVSLYNNHLNGILADEMGLGKTVQVISLICYLMETKNDRGPFLVVVPSSVLPGWDSEINFWAPGINKIMYSGTPEERRRLFKERIAHQKFNVLLTTYEYLMNKHDRPKLSKIDWHYVIIDEGHRIKNASCKLNADLKHYRSNHRLLLTGTPLQNNLEELWALLNFLLPNIFNSAEDFSQWFNKPFQSNNDSSADEALLSEEENLLIINRLHQVLRPFVLRRLKHKVENELPEKIERLVRCEASAYQKLLMKRVEDNLGSIGNSKGRSVHNTVMELRNICNHPYLSQLHADEVDALLPKHYLPPLVRLCGKMEMVDRLLPKLKATGHRVLFFSTMTRLLDVMEEYLHWKHYRYLRLDGHTSGGDRGALIEEFNRPDSPTFIFLLSIRAGGVGVNLQAADTVLIFDTDWNPQVDLQAQARAHRIGQKRDVLVLRLETVNTVEEQVRAAAEHKLGVANQSITAGFFDNNTSAEDRREYLESLLRECKKEEAAPVLDDDALNDLLARREEEIDVFESIDQQRRELESLTWQKLTHGRSSDGQSPLPLPPRLVTEEDLEPLYKVFHLSETPVISVKRKGDVDLDTQHYGRGKRTREVRSYEDQWTEEEFEKLCQNESPGEPSKVGFLTKDSCLLEVDDLGEKLSLSSEPESAIKENLTPMKRGRGRPRRLMTDTSLPCELTEPMINQGNTSSAVVSDLEHSKEEREMIEKKLSITSTATSVSFSKVPPKGLGRKTLAGEVSRGRGKKSAVVGRTKAEKCSPGSQKNSFNVQSSEVKEDSKKETTKETSTALPSPTLKSDVSKPPGVDSGDLISDDQQVKSENVRNQETQVLSKVPETESRSTFSALATRVSEKKVSVTSKKAAAREARNIGSSKPLRLKHTPAGYSVDTRFNSQISKKDDHDREVQESLFESVNSKSSHKGNSCSSLVAVASSSEGNDSRSVERKELTEPKECASDNSHNPVNFASCEQLDQDSDRGETITDPPASQLNLEITPGVQSFAERIREPSLITVEAGLRELHVPSLDSFATEEHNSVASSKLDQIDNSEPEGPNSLTQKEPVDLSKDCALPNFSVSQAGQNSLVDHEVSAFENRSTASNSLVDLVKDADCSVDVQVEMGNSMETCDLECKNLMLNKDWRDEDRDSSISSTEPALALAEVATSQMSMCASEDISAFPLIAQTSWKPVDPESACFVSDDNTQYNDVLASKGHSADTTCVEDEGNDVSLALRDKLHDCDASASKSHSSDAPHAEDEGIDVNVASEDKTQVHAALDSSGLKPLDKIDYDASATECCAEDAPYIQDEGNYSGFPLEDKNQGYDVSVSVGHTGDTTGLKIEGYDTDIPSQNNNHDFDVLPSEGNVKVAICSTDEDDNVKCVLQDKNEYYNASSLKGHTEDASCMDDPALFDKNQDYGASVPSGYSADAICAKSEGDDEIQDFGASVSGAHSADAVYVKNDVNDKNQDCVASVSEGHRVDATCIIRNGGNDKKQDYVALASEGHTENSMWVKNTDNNKNQDYFGSVPEDHTLYSSCVKNEGSDEKQDYVASVPEGDTENSTCVKNEGSDLNQDYVASVAEVHTADATCIKQGDDALYLESLGKNQDCRASASKCHSEDATCIKDDDTDTNLASNSDGLAAGATCIKDDASNVSTMDLLPHDQASNLSLRCGNSENMSDISSVPLPKFEPELTSPLPRHDDGCSIDSSLVHIVSVDSSSFELPVASKENSASEQPIDHLHNSSSEQPVADVDNSGPEQSILDVDNPSQGQPVAEEVDSSSAEQPVNDVDNLSAEQPVTEVDTSYPEQLVAVLHNSSQVQDVADADNPYSEQPIAGMANPSSEQPIADVCTSSPQQPIADMDYSSWEQDFADRGNPSPKQHITDMDNTFPKQLDVEMGNSTSEQPIAELDTSSSEKPLAEVDNSSQVQDVANVDNLPPEQSISGVGKSSPTQLIPDVVNSSSARLVADVNTSPEPLADMNNSSPAQGFADMDHPSPEQPIAGVDDSFPKQLIAYIGYSSSEQLTAELETLSLEQPHADVDNSSVEQAVADVENPTREQPIAGADNLFPKQLIADVDNSSSEHPVADMERSSSEWLIADVDNSSSEHPVADMERSSSERLIADVDNSSSEHPVADMERSSSERLIADVDNSSSVQPVADMESSSSEQPTADVETSSPEQPVKDMDNSSWGQGVADEDHPSPKRPIDGMDISFHKKLFAEVGELSSDQPVAELDTSSLEQSVADADLSAKQLVADLDHSSSEQVVANVVNSSYERAVVDVDNSSSEKPFSVDLDSSLAVERGICSKNTGEIEMSDPSDESRINKDISESGNNSAISEALQRED